MKKIEHTVVCPRCGPPVHPNRDRKLYNVYWESDRHPLIESHNDNYPPHIHNDRATHSELLEFLETLLAVHSPRRIEVVQIQS